MKRIRIQKSLSLTAGLLVVTSLAATVHCNAESLVSGRIEDSYTERVRECMDLLMQYGTDRYGEVHAPILVSILDVETRDCPEQPESFDEAFRVIRRERRNPAGANLLTDQPTLRAMYALSDISGEKDYAAFADRYAGYFMENLVDDQGFFWWGWHRHYDVFKDSRAGHAPNRAKWERWYAPFAK